MTKIENINSTSQYASIKAVVLEKKQDNDYLMGDKTGTILVNTLGSTASDLIIEETYKIQNALISYPNDRLCLSLGTWGHIAPSNTKISIDNVNYKNARSNVNIKTGKSHNSAWNLFLSIISLRFLWRMFRR